MREDSPRKLVAALTEKGPAWLHAKRAPFAGLRGELWARAEEAALAPSWTGRSPLVGPPFLTLRRLCRSEDSAVAVIPPARSISKPERWRQRVVLVRYLRYTPPLSRDADSK